MNYEMQFCLAAFRSKSLNALLFDEETIHHNLLSNICKYSVMCGFSLLCIPDVQQLLLVGKERLGTVISRRIVGTPWRATMWRREANRLLML